MVETLHVHCSSACLIPGSGNEDSAGRTPKLKKKKKISAGQSGLGKVNLTRMCPTSPLNFLWGVVASLFSPGLLPQHPVPLLFPLSCSIRISFLLQKTGKQLQGQAGRSLYTLEKWTFQRPFSFKSFHASSYKDEKFPLESLQLP